ncbi:hypothetical protein BZA05DRAFT_181905 [Tricharina praecox]|uniref:uncharacterized protein n=1 Tax=Tricharina praecox TaxID=43433 RepID=UPI00221ED4DA|nr:uncharacterized protein BZA05DRAFT_181905 [Tricharina praecox]KAI5843581.1 hypothetical protein BZA05DRAFT_181905 [Tricharina praecox]
MKYVIVVNGGRSADVAMTTDIIALMRHYLAQRNTRVAGVHSSERNLQSQRGVLKKEFLEQMVESVRMLKSGDSLLVCILTHGAADGYAMLDDEYVTKLEIYNALKGIPRDSRVSIVTTACYAGMWPGITRQIPPDKNAIHIMACGPKEKSQVYRTFSNFYRCSLHAAEFLTEIRPDPDRTLRVHHKRVAARMAFVDANSHEGQSKPMLEGGRQTLWNHCIDDWIPVAAPVAQSFIRHMDAAEKPDFLRQVENWLIKNVLATFGDIPPYKADHIRGLLEQELKQLQCGPVVRFEVILVECTKYALKAHKNPPFQLELIRVYEYIGLLKERAAAAVRFLIADGALPSNVYRDAYDLGQLFTIHHGWMRHLSTVVNISESAKIPSTIFGGVYDRHVEWLACVFAAGSAKSSNVDLEVCVPVFNRAFFLPAGDWKAAPAMV